MANLSLKQIAQFTDGQIIQGNSSHIFKKYNIDSRLTSEGELFFAIKSKRDGHEFVNDAFQKGAKGAVISQKIPVKFKDRALVFVSDTLKALQDLAKKVALIYKPIVIGITGSAGKTTVKEFSASLVKPFFHALKAEKNFNNYLGVPLTLLKLQEYHRVAILEMGMSSFGEIKRLTEIAPPDVSVITNINPVHLQFFNNIEEIALAKKEILEGTKKNGIAVLNADDPLVKKIEKDFNGEKIHFGLCEESTIRATDIEFKGFSGISFNLIYGEEREKVMFKPLSLSYLYDLLAALGITYTLNIKLKDIIPIISELHPVSMRGELIKLKPNIILINDSYNSNPKALEFALRDYSHLPAKRRIAVLGDMLELGKDSPNFHFQAGEKVSDFGYHWLITVGKDSKKMLEGALLKGMNQDHLLHFNTSNEAAEYIINFLKEGDLILIKGSRGIRMEEIVNKIKNKWEQ